MSAARPRAPWTKEARASRRAASGRLPGRARAGRSHPPRGATAPRARRGPPGSAESSRRVSSACASLGASSRSRSSRSRCSGSSHGTSLSAAGVQATTTRSTSSGRRAASASATRPPADQPRTPTARPRGCRGRPRGRPRPNRRSTMRPAEADPSARSRVGRPRAAARAVLVSARGSGRRCPRRARCDRRRRSAPPRCGRRPRRPARPRVWSCDERRYAGPTGARCAWGDRIGHSRHLLSSSGTTLKRCARVGWSRSSSSSRPGGSSPPRSSPTGSRSRSGRCSGTRRRSLRPGFRSSQFAARPAAIGSSAATARSSPAWMRPRRRHSSSAPRPSSDSGGSSLRRA